MRFHAGECNAAPMKSRADKEAEGERKKKLSAFLHFTTGYPYMADILFAELIEEIVLHKKGREDYAGSLTTHVLAKRD